MEPLHHDRAADLRPRHDQLVHVELVDYFEKAFLLPRGDVVLKHYVDQWLTMALNDGTYEEITEPWLGDVDLALPDRG